MERTSRIRSAWLLGAALVVAGGLLMVHGMDTQDALLPDGSHLALEGWTFGRRHVLKVHGSRPWERFTAMQEAGHFDTDADFFTLWLRVTPKAGSDAGAHSLPPPLAAGWAEVTDDLGSTVRTDFHDGMSGWIYGASFIPPAGTKPPAVGRNILDLPADTVCLLFSNFPRRGTRLHIRLHAASPGAPVVAEFTTPNPAPGRYPPATGDPLPIRAHEDDLDAALTDLKTVQATVDPISRREAITPVDAGTPTGQGVAPGALQRIAEFETSSNGKPVRGWKPVGINLLDATSNVSEPAIEDITLQEPNRSRMRFADTWCSGEKSGGLQVEFQRTDQAEFASREQFPRRGLKVPVSGQVTSDRGTWVWYYTTVRFEGICGSGHVRWPDGTERNGATAAVRVTISPPDAGLRVMLRGTDETGRAITGEQPGDSKPWLTSGDEPRTRTYAGDVVQHVVGIALRSQAHLTRVETIPIRIPPGAKTINLTFALNRTLTFTFTPALR